VARETGRPGCRLEEIDVLGPPLASLHPRRFRPAPITDVGFGLPAPVRRTLQQALTARPEVMTNCVRCGDCVRHCPPQAMTLDARGVQIDYRRCIRCFCCQELCPQGAVLTRQGVLLRLAAFLGGRG
jgi:ferredoxin